jgi:hypothetical protein
LRLPRPVIAFLSRHCDPHAGGEAIYIDEKGNLIPTTSPDDIDEAIYIDGAGNILPAHRQFATSFVLAKTHILL